MRTRSYCTPTRNIADYHTFGGLIYPSDFDRRSSMSDIADRIISDAKFNYACKQNAINRENKKLYKTGSVA